ncbi:MAG: T9SS type A sorting domain-containing protein, partial [Cryomorphaceae bacterium]|nr:T9SS type A sorting domain-containing protein [Cryomorphaceae bacterium]
IIDTSYTTTTILPNSLVKVDDKLVFFHRQSNLVETVELPGYNLLPTDTIFTFSRPFSRLLIRRAYRYNDSLILTSNYLSHGFMLLDNDLNIVDSMSIPAISSTNGDTYYDLGSSVIKKNSFYYGCTTPSISVLNPFMQGDIVVFKIKDLEYQWDCLISDDSTNKLLTSMYFSNDSAHIFLQYMEYDQRKGNLEYDVVVTMMDTMCNILSTHKIAKQKVDVLVYPNPTSEAFTFKGSPNDTYALSLYNLSGKAVLKKVHVASGTSINVDHLPAGMYMLHVQSQRNPEQTRVIKVVVR